MPYRFYPLKNSVLCYQSDSNSATSHNLVCREADNEVNWPDQHLDVQVQQGEDKVDPVPRQEEAQPKRKA